MKPPKNKVTVNGGDESSGEDADGEATDGETKTDAEDGKRTAVTPKQSLRRANKALHYATKNM